MVMFEEWLSMRTSDGQTHAHEVDQLLGVLWPILEPYHTQMNKNRVFFMIAYEIYTHSVVNKQYAVQARHRAAFS
jgi:hypothetical protein